MRKYRRRLKNAKKIFDKQLTKKTIKIEELQNEINHLNEFIAKNIGSKNSCPEPA